MKKIVFFDFLTTLGGAQLSTITLYKKLLESGYNAEFVLPGTPFEKSSSKLPKFTELTNFKCSDILSISKIGYLNVFNNLIKLVSLLSHRFSHDETYIVYNFKSFFILYLAKQFTREKVKLAYYFRGWGKKEQYSFIRRFFIKRADFFLTVSEETKYQASEWVNNENINVVYTSIDFSEFGVDKYVENKSDRINLCFFGSIIPLKGLSEIISLLKKSNYKDKICFHIVGDSIEQEYSLRYKEEILKTLAVNNIQYKLWGRKAPPFDFLYEKSVLLSNSTTEGMPRGVCESIYNNMPVIANPVGGIKDLCKLFPNNIYPCDFYNAEPSFLDNILKNIIDNNDLDRGIRARITSLVDVNVQHHIFIKSLNKLDDV